MIDWIRIFLEPAKSTQELNLRSEDFEIEREKPKPPESRYVTETGRITKGPSY